MRRLGTSFPRLLRVSVLLVMWLVLAAPIVDIVVFGVHDHLASVGAGASGQAQAQRDAAASHVHHCELWMNPGDVGQSWQVPLPSFGAMVTSSVVLGPPASIIPTPFPPPRS